MKLDTKLVTLGRAPVRAQGPVNVPVHRASTILSDHLDGYLHRFDGDNRYANVTYGATGTQNARALAEAVAAIEGGHRTVVTGSGLSAVTMAVSAVVGAGDHMLVPDSVYGPHPALLRRGPGPLRRRDELLRSRGGGGHRGVDAREHAARLHRGARLAHLRDAGTCPRSRRLPRERGALVAMDNTWATPICFRPLEHGVDISIQAGTKYLAGHSDLVIGMVTTATDALFRTIADQAHAFGDTASPDDCFLALRGLRSLSVRLERQSASALKVARWLESRPVVKRVLYPALASDPRTRAVEAGLRGGRRACSGLPCTLRTRRRFARMVDGLELFRIGSSGAGTRASSPTTAWPIPRDVVPWTETPGLLRIHIGLEDPDDLIADLEAGLARLDA